ncbi:MAG: glycosyltransferase family 4 protein [Cyanobacteriota bacterium]|nr:glycosyltransferase family 4 protein [Cyanobacteriota bacterium]
MTERDKTLESEQQKTLDNSVRTLFLTKHSPYPPMGGAPLRNWQNINIMMKFGPVAVFSVSAYKTPQSRQYPPGVAVWKDYNAAEIFPKRSLWRKLEVRLWRLRFLGHSWADQFYGDTVAGELDRLLAEFAPTLVIFEEMWLYRYLKTVKRYNGLTIYDAHNIETSLTRDLNRSADTNRFTAEAKVLEAKTASIERYLIQNADQIWTCSTEEATSIQQLCDRTPPVYAIANGVNVADYQGDRIPTIELASNPFTLLFTASFSYKPNAVAAEILIDRIYPQLRKQYPDCRLILAGHSPTPHMEEAAKIDSGIIVTGKVPDMRPYLAAASVVIVPLLTGGGTRLKILEAFAARRPVVSTTKGAEGLNAQDGQHLLIRDSVEEMVAGVSQLWSKPNLVKKLTKSAAERVKSEYSWEAVGQSVKKAIGDLL